MHETERYSEELCKEEESCHALLLFQSMGLLCNTKSVSSECLSHLTDESGKPISIGTGGGFC